VQQLKAELLHLAQFAGRWRIKGQRMGVWRWRRGRILAAALGDLLQSGKQFLAVFLVVLFTHGYCVLRIPY
jgi:hypothetical protein